MFSDDVWKLLENGQTSPEEVSKMGADETANVLNELLQFLEIRRGLPRTTAVGVCLVDFYHKMSMMDAEEPGVPPSTERLLTEFLGGGITSEKLLLLHTIMKRYFIVNEVMIANFAADREKAADFSQFVKQILTEHKDHPAIGSAAIAFSVMMDLMEESMSLLQEIYKYPELLDNMKITAPPSSLDKNIH